MSKLLFAITREDPFLEGAIVGPQDSVLTVASGGCTPLYLKTRYPGMTVNCFDINPTQLSHVEEKINAISMGQLNRLNVESNDPQGLNQCGELEGLFRILKKAWIEFICPEDQLFSYFSGRLSLTAHKELAQQWIDHEYWMVPFHAALNDSFLHLVFSDKATQHAGRNSYPKYFAQQIANGLLRNDGPQNPFLQHILLGYFKQQHAPSYVFAKRNLNINLIEGSLTDIADIGRYQLVSLSNVLDWSDEKLGKEWATHLKQLQPGAKVLLRQLNNNFDWTPHFSQHFTELNLEQQTVRDRSLFYNQIRLFQRT